MAHFGARYVQHNLMIRNGVGGFRSFVKDLKEQFPIKRVFADGDFVILHDHAKREPKRRALRSWIFFGLRAARSSNEHRDLRQPIRRTRRTATACPRPTPMRRMPMSTDLVAVMIYSANKPKASTSGGRLKMPSGGCPASF